jgi:hypothetical protein
MAGAQHHACSMSRPSPGQHDSGAAQHGGHAADHERMLRDMRSPWLWTNAAVMMLGLWLASSPFTFGYATPAMIWSDVASGVLLVLFAGIALAPQRLGRDRSRADVAAWCRARPVWRLGCARRLSRLLRRPNVAKTLPQGAEAGGISSVVCRHTMCANRRAQHELRDVSCMDGGRDGDRHGDRGARHRPPRCRNRQGDKVLMKIRG